MSISAAQFALWMQKRDAERVLLAEMKYAYESGGNVAEGTLYFARGDYATDATDTPASQAYRDVIQSVSFDRSIDVNTLGGRSRFAPSSLKLANPDGSLDFMLDKIVDGREVRFYMGARRRTPGWTRADFRLVLVAVVERVEATERDVTVTLRDKRFLLGREIKGNPLGGSGPNATKYLPLLWGYAQNVDLVPYIYDDVTLEYGVISNYGLDTSGVSDVRDGGLSLRSASETWTSGNTTCVAGTDVVTHAGHTLAVNDVVWFNDTFVDQPFSQLQLRQPFAHAGSAVQLWVKTVNTPNPGDVTFSLTKGGATLDFTAASWNPGNGGLDLKMYRQRFYDNTRTDGRIQLSSKSTGRVTADVFSYQRISGAEGTWFTDYTAPFDLAGGLMYGYGGLTLAEVNEAGTIAADIALDAKVATGYTSLWSPDRQNLINVLDGWVDMVFGWYGDDNFGVMNYGLADPSGLSVAAADYTLAEVELIDGLSCQNVAPTISSVNVNYALNRTVQSDLLATVTDANRTRYGAPFGAVQVSTAPSGTAYATNKPLYHKTMTAGDPRDTSIDTSIPGNSTPAPIANFSNEVVEDRRPHLRVLRGKVGIDKYAWALGKVVTVTHSRFGLSAGVKCRVVGLNTDLVGETIDLTLLTYAAPQTAVGSHA